MSRNITTFVAVFAIPLGINVIAAVNMLPKLETATRQQCINHDWPVEQHQAHINFCNEYGYPTK